MAFYLNTVRLGRCIISEIFNLSLKRDRMTSKQKIYLKPGGRGPGKPGKPPRFGGKPRPGMGPAPKPPPLPTPPPRILLPPPPRPPALLTGEAGGG